MRVIITIFFYINVGPLTFAVHLDLHNRKLASVPNDLPSSVQHLDLSANSITKVTHEVLKGMSTLQHLDLSYNKLHGLPVDVFYNLVNLTELNMAFNWVKVSYSGLPRGVFRDQGLHLRVLKLTTLADVDEWAVDSLADLHALEELHLNFPAMAPQFPLPIAQLPKLTLLNMQCNDVPVGRLSAKWLEPLKQSNLQQLSLHGCSLSYLEPGLFADFPRLGVLNLACTAVTNTMLDNVTNALAYLGNTPLKTLILDGASKQAAWLRPSNVCNDIGRKVIHFSIKANYIAFVQLNMLKCFSQIKSLSVAFNTFVPIVRYTNLNKVWPLLPSTLEWIDMSDLLTPTYSYPFKKEFCYTNKIYTPEDFFRDATKNLANITYTEPKITKADFENKTRIKVVNLSSVNLQNLKYVYCDHTIFSSVIRMSITIFDPPVGVQVVNGSQSGPYTGIFVMFFVYGLNSLQIVDISHTYSWDETLDLSKLDSLSPYPQYPSLRVLNTAGNHLVHYLPYLPKLLRNMPRLEELDLSSNNIQWLSRDLLIHCHHLRKLSLADNLLTSEAGGFQLAGTQSITYVDLTGNPLISIPSPLVALWDNVSTSSNLTLVLDHNPLQCDCSSLDTLLFLARRNITLLGGENVRCNFKSEVVNISFDSSLIKLMDIEDFKKDCKGVYPVHKTNKPLTAGLAVAILLLTGLSVIMLRKFKLQLRVCYYRFLFGYHRNQNILDDTLEYHICVVYSEKSEQDTHYIMTTVRPVLEPEGYQLFICGRDDRVGTNRYEEMYRGISTSEKLLILLTDDFLQDAWCDFAIQAAKLEVPMQNICILCSSEVDIAKITSQPLKTLVQSGYILQIRVNLLADQREVADRLTNFASGGENMQCMHF